MGAMRAFVVLGLLTFGLGAASTATALLGYDETPVLLPECHEAAAEASFWNVVSAKEGAESLNLDALEAYVSHAGSALGNMSLGIPPSGPLNPAAPYRMTDTTVATGTDGSAMALHAGGQQVYAGLDALRC